MTQEKSAKYFISNALTDQPRYYYSKSNPEVRYQLTTINDKLTSTRIFQGKMRSSANGKMFGKIVEAVDKSKVVDVLEFYIETCATDLRQVRYLPSSLAERDSLFSLLPIVLSEDVCSLIIDYVINVKNYFNKIRC
jgi:hypothetical protein